MVRRHNFITSQISFADLVAMRLDNLVEDWSLWRNAQLLDDSAKVLVDTTYREEYDRLMSLLLALR